MLLENLDSIFDRARSNLCRHVDAVVIALTNGQTPPPYKPIRLLIKSRQIKRNYDELLEDCKLGLREFELLEKMSRKNKGGLTAGELFLLRQEGMYGFGHDSAGVDDAMGAFIPSNDPVVDCSYGIPKRLSVFQYNEPDLKKDVMDRLSDRCLMTLERLYRLPFDQIPSGPGYAYIWRSIIGWERREQMRFDWYLTIANDGTVHHCLTPSTQTALIKSKRKSFDHGRPISSFITIPNHGFKQYTKWFYLDKKTGEHKDMLLASFINSMIAVWRQRFFFPTLRVEDEKGRAIVLSIREDEIPLLLKNRDAKDDKKSALMHWVKSHQRKGGALVRTHLRGATECTINGMRALVMLPGDVDKAPSKATRKKLDRTHEDFDLTMLQEDVTSNKVLAMLFKNAGLKYERKSDQEKDWKKELALPITKQSMHTFTDATVTETYYDPK